MRQWHIDYIKSEGFYQPDKSEEDEDIAQDNEEGESPQSHQKEDQEMHLVLFLGLESHSQQIIFHPWELKVRLTAHMFYREENNGGN